MNQILRWKQPPPSETGPWVRTRERKPNPWVEVAAALRGRPGEWAVVYEGNQGQASGLAQNIKHGRTAPFAPAGDFEALTRGVATYARFIGEPSPEVKR